VVITLPAVLDAHALTKIHSLLAHAPWEDGALSAGDQARQVKNNQQVPRSSPAGQAIQSLVLQALEQQPLFLSAALPKRVWAPQVNRYEGATNHYGAHVDSAIRLMPPNGQPMRTDWSCTLFLSPADTYEGGELLLHHALGRQQVKLPAGHAVLYPANRVHEVTPVTRGTRLACFFWVESLVRDAEHRQLLFDLDQTIMAIRQRHGESDEATRLTGTYHNLLRLWATP
jgi:PKHD-type hydroxylase